MASLSLTKEQQQAFDTIKGLIEDNPGTVTSLSGYAGSGKTTLLRYMADELADDYTEVYMAAPTHKAAEVLGRKFGMDVSTVHSLFGLKPVWNGKGGYKFVPSKNDPLKFEWGSLLCIDEASMIPTKLDGYVQKAADSYNVTVIYSGDLAQLPPVNEEPSPALDFPGYTLENIVRQAKGNPIIEASMDIRNCEKPIRYSFEEESNDKGSIRKFQSEEELVMAAIEEFEKDEYKEHGDHARILAYRNDTVEAYNQVCREAIHGTGEQFIEGEWLVAKSPWSDEDAPDWVNTITTSEEFVVRGKEPSKLYGLDTWILEISSTPDSNDIRHIEVLNRDELEKYEQRMNDLKENALDDRSKWRTYYKHKEAYADVDYSYAMTVHRSQGSTFQKTFVDVEDITSSPNTHEIGRLLYVAATRASEDLAVYQW